MKFKTPRVIPGTRTEDKKMLARTVATAAALLTAALFPILTSADDPEPVKVLLARGSTAVSESVVRDALAQANAVLTETGLTSHAFESAVTDEGTPTVFFASCTGTSETPSTALTTCAIDNFADLRHEHSADVVLMVTNDMLECGGVPPSMINSEISDNNDDLAYAVIKLACHIAPTRGMQAAAHELGHLLSLEHHDNDPEPSVPESYNHAAEDSLLGFGDLTAEGSIDDCALCDFHDFFSANGKLFPDDDPAGDAEDSDSKRIIEEQSWEVVAAYRPKPDAVIKAVQYTILNRKRIRWWPTPESGSTTMEKHTIRIVLGQANMNGRNNMNGERTPATTGFELP